MTLRKGREARGKRKEEIKKRGEGGKGGGERRFHMGLAPHFMQQGSRSPEAGFVV